MKCRCSRCCRAPILVLLGRVHRDQPGWLALIDLGPGACGEQIAWQGASGRLYDGTAVERGVRPAQAQKREIRLEN